jgi:hypothetical protein
VVLSTDPQVFVVSLPTDRTIVANFDGGGGVRPANDDRASAMTIDVGFSQEFTTARATTEPGEPEIADCAGEGAPHIGKTIWFRYAPNVPGGVSVRLETLTFDVVMGLYENGTLVACSWRAYSASFPVSGMAFDAVAGSVYEFQVGGSWGESGLVRMTMSAV